MDRLSGGRARPWPQHHHDGPSRAERGIAVRLAQPAFHNARARSYRYSLRYARVAVETDDGEGIQCALLHLAWRQKPSGNHRLPALFFPARCAEIMEPDLRPTGLSAISMRAAGRHGARWNKKNTRNPFRFRLRAVPRGVETPRTAKQRTPLLSDVRIYTGHGYSHGRSFAPCYPEQN